ncbi:MAG: pyridoxal phosphate-dependent aminotransferase [Bacteroidetes bacterium MedPE-SWsnd-G2]|nr:MAG: pyridoxal phosphate-dependent aminotransferase [Bacteroidetes bacterium MedPE-SWsnd-G2]
MDSKIWLSSPHMGGREQHYINQAFDSNWIAPLGPNVDGFESDLEQSLSNKVQIAALSSGTAAIHLGLKVLGVSKGDEVICQSKTFSASVNPILYLGASPVFVDSELDTWNLCPMLLKKAIQDRIAKGKKPKAIIAVHLYGMPYKVTEIHEIADQYNIPVLEDSAEALGSSYKSQPCGTFGKVAALSFNGNKIITTSGGGALCCPTNEIKNKIIHWSTQSRDKGVSYLHSEIGYNYRMSNILAGIGRGQMEVLKERVNARRRVFDFYKSELNNIKAITFLEEPEGYFSNRWLTTILLDSYDTREELRLALNEDNIESRPLWKPMHQQPVFKNYPSYINGNSDALFERGLCLPSGSNLTNIDLNRVTKNIKSYFSVC